MKYSVVFGFFLKPGAIEMYVIYLFCEKVKSKVFLTGCCTFVWIIVWVFTVTSVPNNHPCMSRVEKDYIIDAIGPTIVSEETVDVCSLVAFPI